MTVLSRSFLDLSRRCGCHSIFTRREFSKIPPIEGPKRKVQRVGEKTAEGSTRREKDENTQRDGKANVKVCIIGGGVTPLYTAILLKQYRIIKSIRLVGTKDSMSEALTDTSHLETSPRIDSFRKKDMKQALQEVNIVALMDETDVAATSDAIREQFKSTADYVCQMTDGILRFCPNAVVAVFARPVTATLAMVSEIFRCAGWRNPDRIVGSTAMYREQIEETTAAILNLQRVSISVPLAGGADARTIVPLLSRTIPFNQFTNAQRKTLLQSFQSSDEETRKGPTENPSLSFGTAAAKLLINLAAGLSGHDHVITCAYVRSDVLPICRFFTSELELGPGGIKRNLGLPKLSAKEVLQIEQVIPLINEHVDMAIAAVGRRRLARERADDLGPSPPISGNPNGIT